MLHVLERVFGFLREFAILLGRAMFEVGRAIHDIWHQMAAVLGPTRLIQHPVLLHGRWLIFTTPAWWAPVVATIGFIALLRYSQLRATSAWTDLALSLMVAAIGTAMLGLLK